MANFLAFLISPSLMVSERLLPLTALRERLNALVLREGSRRKIATQADIHHQTLLNFLSGKTKKLHKRTHNRLARLVTELEAKPYQAQFPSSLQTLAIRKGLSAEEMIRMAQAKLKTAKHRDERFWEDLAVAIRAVPGIFDS